MKNGHKLPTKTGLASASPETRTRVAIAGGKAAQASGKAHQLTAEERRRGARASKASLKKRKQPENIEQTDN